MLRNIIRALITLVILLFSGNNAYCGLLDDISSAIKKNIPQKAAESSPDTTTAFPCQEQDWPPFKCFVSALWPYVYNSR